jgi:hypothetical protein
MVNVKIADGFGTSIQQRVFPSGASYTTSNQIPPFGEPWPVQPFVAQMATSAGATDMRVAGSLAAPVDFFINASTTTDRFITAVSFVIADDNPSLVQFGAITALTNGCLLNYETPSQTIQVLPALRSNFDFVRVAQGYPAFSSGNPNDAFKAGTVIGTAEAYIPVIRFADWLPPFGLKLDINSGNRLIFRVRDNTSGIDRFDAICFGFDRGPEKHRKPV